MATLCAELGTPGGRCFLDEENCPWFEACYANLNEKFAAGGLEPPPRPSEGTPDAS